MLVVCTMLYLYLLRILRRVLCVLYHSLFLLKYGFLGEKLFRGVWNKAQALVYVASIFSKSVSYFLML